MRAAAALGHTVLKDGLGGGQLSSGIEQEEPLGASLGIQLDSWLGVGSYLASETLDLPYNAHSSH